LSLLDDPDTQIYLLGGRMKQAEVLTISTSPTDELENYNVDTFVMGIGGVHSSNRATLRSQLVPTLTAPFFEIGPKNLMRRAELLALARSAEAAAAEYGVTTILTLPVALIYLVKTAHPRLLVFAQTMSTEIPGPSVGAVIAESLVDAGADGVVLNHASCPMEFAELSAAVDRASGNGLQTIVCAGDLGQAISVARLRPTVVLFEPPELIGHAG
jgi:triosephosphate isomerase (TIM)